jgi:hypothetical protein
MIIFDTFSNFVRTNENHSRDEKLDLAEVCMRGKLVANLVTKFAHNLQACVFKVCKCSDLQQI